MDDFSSLKIFWVICSLFTILPQSSKLTSMSFHLASFSLPEEKNHDTVLQEWFGFHQWDNIITQLCLTPISTMYSSYARKQHADQYTGSPGHLCLAITFHLHWALSCWWITVAMERIIQGRGRQQHLAILWQAQLSFPRLHLWSNVKSWTWLRDWRLLPGDLQTRCKTVSTKPPLPSPVGRAGRIPFACAQCRASGSLAQVISCTV